MRYFTPKLVLQLNSSDSETVDEAMEQWEKAIVAYRKRLEKMPLQSLPIANLSLHDWNLVNIAVAAQKGATVVIALRDNENLVFLVYLLTQKLRRIDSPEDWPFSKSRFTGSTMK